MQWTVLRVELRNLWRDASLWAVMAVFGVLVAYATLGGWTFTRGESRTLAGQVEEDARRLAELREQVVAIAAGAEVKHTADPRNPLAVGERLAPRVAVLPPGPLALVAVGQRDVLPQAITLTVATRLADAPADDGSSPSRRANGPFDLAFVVVFLLPLLVIALSYDLLAGERERGTLALVLSQPVSLASFVLGKAIARAGIVMVVVLALCLAGPVVLGGPLGAGGVVRLGLYAALLVVYTLFWFLLAVAVDAWGRSAAANAMALVGLWLGLAVVVPGLVSVAVDALHPPPSRVELVNLARAAARSAEARASDLEGDHGKATPAAEAARRGVAVQEELARRLDPVLTRFERQRDDRQAMVDRLRFVSPAIVTSEGLADVSGSSVGRNSAFSSQVDAFHDRLRRFFFHRAERGASLGVADYDAMPSFVFLEPPDGALVLRILGGVASLAFASTVAFAVALAGLRRQASRGFG